MSRTWTSDLTEDDRSFQRIVDYFVLRRGRGSSVSSRDIDALETWARNGHTWMDIVQAIDRAFAKRTQPPQSLAQCGSYLVHRTRTDELLDANILAQAFGQSHEDAAKTPPASDATPPVPVQAAAVARALAHLKREALTSTDPRAQRAYRALHQEIVERAEEETLSPETIGIFDEALALLGLENLDDDEKRDVECYVDGGAPSGKTRRLLIAVGERLDLCYPHHGRLHRS